MGVLTESEIRRRIGKNKDKLTEFYIEKGQIITPSAKSYLLEKSIELKYVDSLSEVSNEPKEIIKEVIKEKSYKYTTVFGAKLDEKPEHMTQLNGNLLVFKDHKRIILRGKIDSLESKILEGQILSQKSDMPKLTKDLQEILNFVRNIMRCEVLEEKLEEFTLLGLTPDELREQSHYPQKYFGIGHEFPSYDMGEVVVCINSIRSATREAELCAYEAFKGEYGQVEREDLIKALNRLSSVFWIMIYKIRTGKYK
ncbi:cobalamin adenosyltransferase [Romboutsia lituseburensis]|uniref:cobalamin adenosyltransferase n=1 Tax=Romboutsia lituseburensis TaxID=1537 RepID=UPI0022EA2946|nr:cobalamin adenosyltransferase [Romboutsia lituseburensis]